MHHWSQSMYHTQ